MLHNHSEIVRPLRQRLGLVPNCCRDERRGLRKLSSVRRLLATDAFSCALVHLCARVDGVRLIPQYNR
jgi:hypothetical protein